MAPKRSAGVDLPRLDTEPQFTTQQKAAARWDVSVDVIRRLIASGKLPGYRLNNRIIRVKVAEVDACFRPIPTERVS